jgi:hypothetical protein
MITSMTRGTTPAAAYMPPLSSSSVDIGGFGSPTEPFDVAAGDVALSFATEAGGLREFEAPWLSQCAVALVEVMKVNELVGKSVPCA